MKLKLFIAGIGASLLLTGCSVTSNITKISYDKLEEMWNNEETFILEVMKDDCIYCDEFAPVFNEALSENDIEAFAINLSDFSDEDLQSFYDKTNATSTPTVIFYTDGEESSIMTRIVGAVSKDKVIEKLEAQNYIQ